MAYCTQADIENEITQKTVIQLTDDTGSGTVDASKVSRAIADADALIDSYAGVKYAVPFTIVPERIKQLSIDIAIYHLYSRRGKVPEMRQAIYEDAVNFLKDISAGRATLGVQPRPTETPEGGPEFRGEERVFGRENMEGF